MNKDFFDQRIIEMEKKVSFQEHLLAELNGVLVAQQRKLDELEGRLQDFKHQLTSGELVRRQDDEIPPPHY